ncbi:MAG: hypothetical protein JWO52_8143 [Gammaproteobacteria bacterium]|nr:hypothetical protein [Gammaproteobacteria bacterium]
MTINAVFMRIPRSSNGDHTITRSAVTAPKSVSRRDAVVGPVSVQPALPMSVAIRVPLNPGGQRQGQ